MKSYFVYISNNQNYTARYAGVANNLARHVTEHKAGVQKGFTKRHKLDKLLYFEESPNIMAASEREKQVKAGTRAKKLALINDMNLYWEELAGVAE